MCQTAIYYYWRDWRDERQLTALVKHLRKREVLEAWSALKKVVAYYLHKWNESLEPDLVTLVTAITYLPLFSLQTMDLIHTQ